MINTRDRETYTREKIIYRAIAQVGGRKGPMAPTSNENRVIPGGSRGSILFRLEATGRDLAEINMAALRIANTGTAYVRSSITPGSSAFRRPPDRNCFTSIQTVPLPMSENESQNVKPAP